MNRKITKIEAIRELPTKQRVAAYARVSCAKDEMLHSLAAQVSHYSGHIQYQSDWEYAGVYADEARTGTKDNRPEFQRLITDCRHGKIDLVLTKSISRFARNTVILLETIRELKDIGVGVYFEEQNINTLSAEGELMLTILASYAQEESRSASENIKWRIRNDFKKGKASSTAIMGYVLVNGTFIIIPQEAEIVKRIFDDFLGRMGKLAIMKKLISMDIPTKCGGDWNEKTIDKMLRNEKYMGDMLLQKSFRSDHINKKKIINRGELPMYHIVDSHEPIIDRKTFQLVQAELEKRAALHHPTRETPETYPFTGKIVCGHCGKNYRRKIANAGTPYERIVWICNTFNRLGRVACPSQQIPEDILLKIADMDFKQIRVPEPNTIILVMPDGSEIERLWQHKSRRESWTDEMKAAAREKAKGGRING